MNAEERMAIEFPELYAHYAAHPLGPPRPEIWERLLRISRQSAPILAEIRARGLDLIDLQQLTPVGADPMPRCEVILEWLTRIEEPVTLAIALRCLCETPKLLRKNRELVMEVIRSWNADPQRAGDEFNGIDGLFVSLATERNVQEIVAWARDPRMPLQSRWRYWHELKRFAKKPGLARQELLAELAADTDVSGGAAWALAEAMKGGAEPILRERRATASPALRQVIDILLRKLEARRRRPSLPIA